MKDAPIWAKEKNRQASPVDELAKELINKVEYGQLSQIEKIQFLEI